MDHNIMMIIILVLALAIPTHTIEASNATPLHPDEQQQEQEEAMSPSPMSPPLGIMSRFPKTHLIFRNLLGNGQRVSLHAQSVSYDFGTWSLADQQVGEITFQPFLISLFTDIRCDFDKKDGYALGLVYRHSRDWKRCYNSCSWVITPGGVFGLNNKGVADVYLEWWPNSNVHRSSVIQT